MHAVDEQDVKGKFSQQKLVHVTPKFHEDILQLIVARLNLTRYLNHISHT